MTYLRNDTYGLGVPEEHIDKYKFFQVAQYCDACDAVTGKFTGVDALADGSFRHKPRNQFDSIRENQIGLPSEMLLNKEDLLFRCLDRR